MNSYSALPPAIEEAEKRDASHCGVSRYGPNTFCEQLNDGWSSRIPMDELSNQALRTKEFADLVSARMRIVRRK